MEPRDMGMCPLLKLRALREWLTPRYPYVRRVGYGSTEPSLFPDSTRFLQDDTGVFFLLQD